MKLKSTGAILILFALLLNSRIAAQYTLPSAGYVFDDETVPRVDVEIEPILLSTILNPDNLESNTEYPATFYFTKYGETDTVKNVGFRLRGNTSRQAAKKSFKISFNSTVQGQKYRKLEKLNLNGEHNDPSILRAKMCWDMYTDMGIPGSRSNHVEFYINGEYKGLYLNVEHIDEQFLKKRFSSNDGNLYKCLFPADLVYKGEDPDLYKEVIFGRRAYDLKTNTDENDYSDLARFIDILNNADDEDFQCELERVFDVDNYLKALVMDILVSNWDGPLVNKNNFYLYHDPDSDRFVYLPYDLDNTMGIGWGSVVWSETDIYKWSETWSTQARPLYEKIMAVPEFRNKVSYYFQHYIQDFFNNTKLDPYLDEFLERLTPFREGDSYASLDYGWNSDDFTMSFQQSVADHVKMGLKPYIDSRGTSILDQLDFDEPLALMEYYKHEWSGSKVKVISAIQFPWNVTGEVFLSYKVNDEEWMQSEMISVEDGEYEYSVTHNGEGNMEYYLEIENIAGSIRYPRCGQVKVPLGLEVERGLVVNELMASNDGTSTDSAGEYDDWIELFNNSSDPLNLDHYYLSDDPSRPEKWQLPSGFLAPGTYLPIWADEDGEQGENHANFKLSKNGEFLGLYFKQDGVLFPVDTLTFPVLKSDESYGRLPNGSGPFQVLPFASMGYNNESSSSVIDLWSESNIDLYPNPSRASVTIASESLILFAKVYDLNGRLMIQEDNPAGTNRMNVNVERLGSGLYIVVVENEVGGLVSKRIVIEK